MNCLFNERDERIVAGEDAERAARSAADVAKAQLGGAAGRGAAALAGAQAAESARASAFSSAVQQARQRKDTKEQQAVERRQQAYEYGMQGSGQEGKIAEADQLDALYNEGMDEYDALNTVQDAEDSETGANANEIDDAKDTLKDDDDQKEYYNKVCSAIMRYFDKKFPYPVEKKAMNWSIRYKDKELGITDQVNMSVMSSEYPLRYKLDNLGLSFIASDGTKYIAKTPLFPEVDYPYFCNNVAYVSASSSSNTGTKVKAVFDTIEAFFRKAISNIVSKDYGTIDTMLADGEISDERLKVISKEQPALSKDVKIRKLKGGNAGKKGDAKASFGNVYEKGVKRMGDPSEALKSYLPRWLR